MFSREKRLSTAEFENVFTSGRPFHTAFFHVRFKAKDLKTGQNPGLSRFAVAVSKKTLTGAFGRHFLKRRVFAFLRALELSFPAGDYIFFPKNGAAELTPAELETAIAEVATKVGSNTAK